MTRAQIGGDAAAIPRRSTAASDRAFFYSHDPDHRFTYVSPAVAAVLGYAPEEMVGIRYDDFLVTGALAEQVQVHTDGALSTGVAAGPYLCVVRHRTGRSVVLELNESTVVRADGTVGGMRGLARDVTERECAVERFEHVLSVLESISDCLFSLDREWCFTYLNRRAESFFGRPRHELVGRSIWAAVPSLDQDVLRRALAASLADGRPTTIDVKPDVEGSEWLECRVHPSADGLTVLLEDVTARRRVDDALRASEQYHRALIEKSGDVVAVINPDATYRYASPSHERMLGFTPAELASRTAVECIEPDDQPMALAALQRVASTRGATAELELRVRHSDGTPLVLQVSATNMLDVPLIGGIVLNAHDITQRRMLEEQLRQSQKMEAVGRLAGGVAHDFNNLLTTISGYAAFVLDGLPPADPLRQDAQQIVHAASSAADLTRQLLLFSRQKVAQPRVMKINDVVGSMDQLLRRVLGEDISLSRALDPHAGMVEADAGHLEQVVMNLVLNARDALSAGGTITVSTRGIRLPQPVRTFHGTIGPGAYVELAVADDGHGIAPAVLPQIFEPFFTTKDAGKGTGLGLATVYGIVRQAGGDIRVWTAPDRGTRFEVLLPVARLDALDAGPDDTPAYAIGGSERVLLVEDEASVRSLIARVLRGLGYSVLEAPHGVEALRALRDCSCSVDLVLTDVVMPEMSGRELAGLVEEHCPGVPVLFMSGYTADEVIRRGIREAEVDLLEKPFTPNALAAAVRRALDAAQVARAAFR